MRYAPPQSDTPPFTVSPSPKDASSKAPGDSGPSSDLPPPSRRTRGSLSPSPKRRTGGTTAAASVSAAGAAFLLAAKQLPQPQGAYLKALVRAIKSGFKAVEAKVGRLHAAVEHLSSLNTSKAGKVDGLAVRVQTAASA